MRHRHTIMAAAAFVIAACDSSTGPTRYTAQGTWVGTETLGTTLISLTLTQQGDSVMGSGTVSLSREIPVTVAGTAASTSFDLTLTSPGFQPVQMTGAFTGRNDIEAYMVGSGFYGDQVLLHRQ